VVEDLCTDFAGGKAIKQAVRAPIQDRQPVGYQRDFLDDYRPNVTWYLPAETRQRLLEMGRPPDGERPAGTYARTIYSRLLIDLSWNSSRLEGNTYSLLETERLLELGEAAEGKDALEAQMILNHKAAIELLVDQADEIGFNRYTILNLHALLADNLLPTHRPAAACGASRWASTARSTIRWKCRSSSTSASRRFWIPRPRSRTPSSRPSSRSCTSPTCRVSRTSTSASPASPRISRLIRGNLCPLSFVDVPERAYIDGVLAVYELNRIELLRDVFVWAYERSSARYSAVRQSLGEPDPFRLRYRALSPNWSPRWCVREWTRKPRLHWRGNVRRSRCRRRTRRDLSKSWRPR
jgi:hypothetical protein